MYVLQVTSPIHISFPRPELEPEPGSRVQGHVRRSMGQGTRTPPPRQNEPLCVCVWGGVPQESSSLRFGSHWLEGRNLSFNSKRPHSLPSLKCKWLVQSPVVCQRLRFLSTPPRAIPALRRLSVKGSASPTGAKVSHSRSLPFARSGTAKWDLAAAF